MTATNPLRCRSAFNDDNSDEGRTDEVTSDRNTNVAQRHQLQRLQLYKEHIVEITATQRSKRRFPIRWRPSRHLEHKNESTENQERLKRRQPQRRLSRRSPKRWRPAQNQTIITQRPQRRSPNICRPYRRKNHCYSEKSATTTSALRRTHRRR